MYDDGDESLTDLSKERYRLLELPRLVPPAGACAVAAAAAGRVRAATLAVTAEVKAGDQQRKRQRCTGSVAGDEANAAANGVTPFASAPEWTAPLPASSDGTGVGSGGGGGGGAADACTAALPGALAAGAEALGPALVGRFCAAYSARLTEQQRRDHAAFLLPLLAAGAHEAAAACLEETLRLVHEPPPLALLPFLPPAPELSQDQQAHVTSTPLGRSSGQHGSGEQDES